jgi:glycosyltransferase involved in cell wall biosynthesis
MQLSPFFIGKRPKTTIIKVCFAVPGFYPLLNPAIPGLIGGSESRALMFAKGLGSLGRYAISAVAFDYGQSRVEQYNGITVHRDDTYCFRPQTPHRHSQLAHVCSVIAGRLGFILTLRRHEARAWKAARANIYCSFGASDYTGKLARWCHTNGRPLVLFSGSEMDFSSDYRPGADGRNVCNSRFSDCYDAVMRAHTIVVQTRTQAQLLEQRFGRRAVIIANPIDLQPSAGRSQTRRSFVWIGKSDAVKRPELVVDLARLCPQVSFRMVLNRVDGSIFDGVTKASPPNLQIIEQASRQEISELLGDSLALINTSRFEGFPNTFLEAGKQGVPVLSLCVDPDDVIRHHAAGFVADGNLERLGDAIRRFHADPQAARSAGENLRAYVHKHHSLPERLVEVDQLLRRIYAGEAMT